ncbi:hypothetical protein GDO78_002230 [Eleutherodactylus coqui]|uniref:Uncharacterized protein n=2 Tax=Eleutherodactylus coqui TaxID=57060 RepID=A0A8J6K2B3_ELECQ|nr:hypothetical protein GDO78_002230 [Eleutherodactylus coqui]
MGDKGFHVPVLGQMPPSSHCLPPPTPLMRANIPRPSGPRPHLGWDGHSRGRHPHSDRPPRNQVPSLTSSGPVYVPPPTPLFPPPPPHGLQLPPGVPPPQFPPQFPPGQPPAAGYNVPPPGFPSAPATVSAPWVTPAVQAAHTNALPAQALAPPLSKEEFYREQRRLKEE